MGSKTAKKAKPIYLALTTTNATANGWYCLAYGADRADVLEAAYTQIGNGADLYTRTEQKNLCVVSKTRAKRVYGFDLDYAINNATGFTAVCTDKGV